MILEQIFIPQLLGKGAPQAIRVVRLTPIKTNHGVGSAIKIEVAAKHGTECGIARKEPQCDHAVRLASTHCLRQKIGRRLFALAGDAVESLLDEKFHAFGDVVFCEKLSGGGFIEGTIEQIAQIQHCIAPLSIEH